MTQVTTYGMFFVVILISLFISTLIILGVWNFILAPLFGIEMIEAWGAALVAVIARGLAYVFRGR